MRTVLAAWLGLLCALPVVGQPQRADVQAEIERADKRFAEAMVKADLAALAGTYADEYVFTDPTGRVTHKAELLDNFRRGVIKIRSQEIRDVQVSAYGDVAIEIGTLVSQATRNGKDSGGTFRFTRIWVKRNGNWQSVAFQETRVIPKP